MAIIASSTRAEKITTSTASIAESRQIIRRPRKENEKSLYSTLPLARPAPSLNWANLSSQVMYGEDGCVNLLLQSKGKLGRNAGSGNEMWLNNLPSHLPSMAVYTSA